MEKEIQLCLLLHPGNILTTSYAKNEAINTIYVSEYSIVHFELKRLVNTKMILIKHMTLSYSLFVIKETSFISSFN